MIDLGQHAIFIVWAYAGVFGAVFGLIALRIRSARRVSRRLRTLEAATPSHRGGS